MYHQEESVLSYNTICCISFPFNEKDCPGSDADNLCVVFNHLYFLVNINRVEIQPGSPFPPGYV